MPQKEALAAEPARASQTARLDAWLHKIGVSSLWKRVSEVNKLTQLEIHCYSTTLMVSFMVVVTRRRGEMTGGSLTAWTDQGVEVFVPPCQTSELGAVLATAEVALGIIPPPADHPDVTHQLGAIAEALAAAETVTIKPDSERAAAIAKALAKVGKAVARG